MPTPNRRHSADRHRALQVLATAPDGCTEAVLLAHGFTVALLAELVRDGLAAASTDRVRAGKREMQVTRVRITDAGREALAGGRK
jgi:hypothetical protein